MSIFNKTCRPIITTALVVSSLLIFGCSTAKKASVATATDTIPVTLENDKAAESDLLDAKLSPKEAKAIAEEAYLFAFPMMYHYKMMFATAMYKESGAYEAPSMYCLIKQR